MGNATERQSDDGGFLLGLTNRRGNARRERKSVYLAIRSEKSFGIDTGITFSHLGFLPEARNFVVISKRQYCCHGKLDAWQSALCMPTQKRQADRLGAFDDRNDECDLIMLLGHLVTCSASYF